MLLPVQKLALHVAGWGLLAILAWFFHIVGFIIVCIFLAMKLNQFLFVYHNTKEFQNDRSTTSIRHDSTYEQPVIPGTEMGTIREGSLRKNVSEGEE